MLRDRLVCGIADQRIQRRLLAEPDLTFAKALELAHAAEAADRNTRALDRGAQSIQIHKIGRKAERSQEHARQGGRARQLHCYRCGGKHQQEQCNFRNSNCHYCGKKGHIAKVCRNKQREEETQQKPNETPQETHLMEEDAERTTTADSATYSLFTLTEQTEATPPLLVDMTVNKVPLQMEVDTGASVSLISRDTYRKLWLNQERRPKLQPSPRRLRTYTGQELDVQGSATVDVTYGSQSQKLPLLVVAGNGPSLLGRDWIQKFSLDLQELKTGTPTQLQDKVCREEPATTGRKRTTKKKFATDEVKRPTEANIFRRGRERKWRQITARKRNSSKRPYHRNDTVYAKGFSNRDPKWVCGKITKVHGKSIAVTLDSGKIICRHIQHIRVCARDPSNTQRNRTCTLNTAVGSKSPTERIT